MDILFDQITPSGKRLLGILPNEDWYKISTHPSGGAIIISERSINSWKNYRLNDGSTVIDRLSNLTEYQSKSFGFISKNDAEMGLSRKGVDSSKILIILVDNLN